MLSSSGLYVAPVMLSRLKEGVVFEAAEGGLTHQNPLLDECEQAGFELFMLVETSTWIGGASVLKHVSPVELCNAWGHDGRMSAVK